MKIKDLLKNRKALLLVVLLALFSRLAFFVFIQPWTWDKQQVMDATHPAVYGDAIEYHKTALRFIDKSKNNIFNAGRGLRSLLDSDSCAKRIPIYPLFIGFFYFFGVSWWPVFLTQLLLDVVTAAMVYLIAKNTCQSKWVPITAGFLYSLSPAVIYYSVQPWPDILLNFGFGLTILLFIKALKTNKVWLFALAGLPLGFTTLFKPVLLYCPIVLVVSMMLNEDFRKNRPTYKLLCILALVLAFFMVLSPWQYRNLKRYGYYSLTTLQDINIRNYGINVRMKAEGLRREDIKAELRALVKHIKNPFERSRATKKIGLEYILKYPMTYVGLHFQRVYLMFARTIGGTRKQRLLGKYSFLSQKYGLGWEWFLKISFILSYKLFPENILLGLGLFAMYSSKKERSYAILFTLIILYIVNTTGVVGKIRFRVHIIPFISIISACGIIAVSKFVKNRCATH